jgi:hypothetical protein
VNFDESGIPHVGPRVAGQDRPVPDSPPDGLWEPVNALREAAKQANARHMGVHRVQASYYVDSQTGERVAVVDAASIAYGNENNDAQVRWGRLATDQRGRPMIVPTPDDVCEVPGQPSVRNANPIRVPLGKDGD